MNLESLGAMSISARSFQNPVVGKRWLFRNSQARVKAKLPCTRAKRAAGWLGVFFGLILLFLAAPSQSAVLYYTGPNSTLWQPETYLSAPYTGTFPQYSGSGGYDALVFGDRTDFFGWWYGYGDSVYDPFAEIYYEPASGWWAGASVQEGRHWNSTFALTSFTEARNWMSRQNLVDSLRANSGDGGTANSVVTEASATWQTTTNTVLYTGLLIGAVWFSYL